MMSTTARKIMIAATAVVVLVGVIVGPRIYANLTGKATGPQLATVSFRSFPVVATATGSLVPSSQIAVSFSLSGQLTEIDVVVGQKVIAGQVIARVDSSVEQAGVAEANASLQAAQASLFAAENPLNPARRQTLQSAVNSALSLLNATRSAVAATNSQDNAAVSADQQRLASDQQRFNNDGCNVNPSLPPCAADQNAINSDQSTLASDRSRQQQDASSGQQRIAEAQANLSQAQANLSASSVADPGQVQVAQAQVAAAQAQVQRAQANLAQTVLTAPAAGSVLAINGQVGELVGNGSTANTTLPGSGQGTTATTDKAFALIGDASSFQVAAPFAETDASRLSTGQTGTFTVDAVPGLTIPCHLLQVAQGSTVTGGVVQYLATIGLDTNDPRLRIGMTVNVDLDVARADNVLAVPNQALYLLDGHLHVDVWFQNRAVSTTVATGLVGSELTQVTSGLSDGQQIVLSAPHGLPSPAPSG